MTAYITTRLLVVIILLTAAGRASAARVLGVFPHHGYSHHSVFLPYLRALADRGHNVLVISHFDSSHTGIMDISVKGSAPMDNNITFPDSTTFGFFATWRDVFVMYNMAKITEGIFEVPAVRQLLDEPDAGFDLVVAEHFNSDLSLGFAAKYRAPLVLLSSCPLMPWTSSLVGQPQLTAHRPFVFSGLSPRMDLAQRLANTLMAHVSDAVFQLVHRSWSKRVVKKHLGVDLSVDEFASNVSLVLVNTHWSINGASATVPSVLEVGGMHMKPSKPLPAN
uniref:UDP-glucuronosyltransferase 2B2 n=2 Tax=Sipha flava TaxID=143950 RepID=A0A2S2QKD4_9HEMI